MGNVRIGKSVFWAMKMNLRLIFWEKGWLTSNHQNKEIINIENYKEKIYDQEYIFWTHFDMVQTEIILLSKLELLDNAKTAAIRLFNQYFGAGMNSIVFQEIREAQGLAYSVYSTFSQANKPDRSDYLYSYLSLIHI